MRAIKSLSAATYCAIFVGLFSLTLPSVLPAQTNPCAPKAKSPSQNPCAANPCAVKNPCAPGGQAAQVSGKAITARGEVVKVDPNSRKLVLKAEGKQIDLALGRYAVVREGPKVKSLKELKPGEKVTVSYVDSGKGRTSWYVYLASAAQIANPCAANPCAVKNPCAPKQPCAPKAKKASKNPCAANPCAVKNPCAPKAKGKQGIPLRP